VTQPEARASNQLLDRLKRTSPLTLLATAAFAWSIASSLLIYPHCLSYFNELAGGPRGGSRFLLDTNTDWGQDLLLIKRWVDNHPQARPVYLDWPHSYLDAKLAGIEAPAPPSRSAPGWHLTSVKTLNSRDGTNRPFRCAPTAQSIGGSTVIYRVRPRQPQ
jgi:hypothetical protein